MRIGVDRLDLDLVGKFEADGLAADQFAIADAAVVASADQAILDGEVLHGKFKPFGGARDQEMPRLRGGVAQGDGRDLDGFAGNGRALIGDARGIAQHDDDTRKGHVEFLGDDLSKRGANARSEIDMAVEGRDRTVGRYLDEGLECAFAAGSGRANDGQGSVRRSPLSGKSGEAINPAPRRRGPRPAWQRA